MPTPTTPGHSAAAQTAQAAFAIANHAVLSDITTQAIATTAEFRGLRLRCWDTRPMLDPRECSPHAIDMATQALAYAEQAGLVERHPQHRYLVLLREGVR